MVKQGLTHEKIDSQTKFRIGECLKCIADDNCYIINVVSDNSLELLNIHDGSTSNVLTKDIIGKYVKVSINPIIYAIVSKRIPHDTPSSIDSKTVLNHIVDDYALQICVDVVEKKGSAIKTINDYPAIVVAAKSKYDVMNNHTTDFVVVNQNYNWFESNWNKKFLDLLKNKGFTLGAKRFDTIAKRDYCFGNCAEQHAVNDLLTLHSSVDIKEIVFSKAIRPRTGEIRLYCQNCCDLFGLKN